MKLVFLLLFLLLTAVGCSSLKDKCEQANWYDRAYDQAKRGHFPDSDNYLKRCKREEALIDYQQLDIGFKKGRSEICDPNKAFKLGGAGQSYNFPICSDYNEEKMRANFNRGIKKYCRASNGYRMGVQGVEYQNVCPTDLEKPFLARYKNGRRQYLEKTLQAKKNQVNSVDVKLERLKRKQKKIHSQLSNRYISQERELDLRGAIQNLSFDIDNLTSEKNVLTEEINNLTESLAKI